MVLGNELRTSFPLLAIVLLGSTAIADISEQDAIQAASAFRLLASRGTAQQTQGDPLRPEQPIVDGSTEPANYIVKYNDNMVTVRRSDGKVVYFVQWGDAGVAGNWGQGLTENEILQLAQIYYSQAGFTETLAVGNSVFFTEANTPEQGVASVGLRAVPILSGVKYHGFHGCDFDIERATGRLMRFQMVDLRGVPSSPQNLVPAITAQQARANICAYLANAKGVSVMQETSPVDLFIWRPEVDPGMESWLTQTHADMAAQNQGLLIYCGTIESMDLYLPGLGVYYEHFDGYVDAQTGALLAIADWTPFGGGGQSRSAPFQWGLGVGTYNVWSDSRKIMSIKGDVMRTGPPTKPPSQKAAKAVFLSKSKATIAGFFDPKSGLLWVEKKGHRSYGKPNRALTDALRKLSSAKKPTSRRGSTAIRPPAEPG